MGLPIISTDVGDVSCYVDNEEEGYIVPVGDHLAMASKLEYLLKNPKKKTNGISSAQVSSKFSPRQDKCFDLEIYKNVCKGQVRVAPTNY